MKKRHMLLGATLLLTGCGSMQVVPLPSLDWASVGNNANYYFPALEVALKVSVPSGQISRVAFYVNQQLVGQDVSAPFEVNTLLFKSPDHRYTLMAVVQQENQVSRIIEKEIDATAEFHKVYQDWDNATIEYTKDIARDVQNLIESSQTDQLTPFKDCYYFKTIPQSPYVSTCRLKSFDKNTNQFILQTKSRMDSEFEYNSETQKVVMVKKGW